MERANLMEFKQANQAGVPMAEALVALPDGAVIYSFTRKSGAFETRRAEVVKGPLPLVRVQYGNHLMMSLHNMGYDVVDEATGKQLVETYIIDSLRARRHLVERVGLNESSGNQLYYSIVLNEDNRENRSSIFEILDGLEAEWFASQNPVYFQFYPDSLKDSINPAGLINLD